MAYEIEMRHWDITLTIKRLGGVATWRELRRAHSRREIDAAMRDGVVARLWHGKYVRGDFAHASDAARRLSGVAVLLTAAEFWGWRMQWTHQRPQVVVPRGRKISPERRAGVDVSWRGIPEADVENGWVTTPLRTALDCMVFLPFTEALSIADSALRSQLVTRAQLIARVETLPKQWRRRVIRVLDAANADADGPFESVLRAHVLDIPGADFTPQVKIEDEDGFIGRVDLACTELKIVLEAESHEFHGEPEAFARDCRRYARMAAEGWTVLRFSWPDVMHKGEWVRRIVEKAVRMRQALLG
ncbi:MAG: DUF559 domain-containing protein [Micrococcales bacterium]|nr:DUF559 domain-containing protein [Micrococcales bacterium]